MVYVAVYGTLKEGHYNHKQYLGRQPVAAGYFPLQAKMYSNGRYPMLVKTHGKRKIFLEIYKVDKDKLVEIDELEAPFNYHREQTSIGEYVDVWIYYYTPNSPPEEFEMVKNGNFVKKRDWLD